MVIMAGYQYVSSSPEWLVCQRGDVCSSARTLLPGKKASGASINCSHQSHFHLWSSGRQSKSLILPCAGLGSSALWGGRVYGRHSLNSGRPRRTSTPAVICQKLSAQRVYRDLTQAGKAATGRPSMDRQTHETRGNGGGDGGWDSCDRARDLYPLLFDEERHGAAWKALESLDPPRYQDPSVPAEDRSFSFLAMKRSIRRLRKQDHHWIPTEEGGCRLPGRFQALVLQQALGSIVEELHAPPQRPSRQFWSPHPKLEDLPSLLPSLQASALPRAEGRGTAGSHRQGLEAVGDLGPDTQPATSAPAFAAEDGWAVSASIHAAFPFLERHLAYNQWVVEGHLPSVIHSEVVTRLLRKYILDPPLLHLLRRFLSSPLPLLGPPRDPMGGLTHLSPILLNLLMHEIDLFSTTPPPLPLPPPQNTPNETFTTTTTSEAPPSTPIPDPKLPSQTWIQRVDHSSPPRRSPPQDSPLLSPIAGGVSPPSSSPPPALSPSLSSLLRSSTTRAPSPYQRTRLASTLRKMSVMGRSARWRAEGEGEAELATAGDGRRLTSRGEEDRWREVRGWGGEVEEDPLQVQVPAAYIRWGHVWLAAFPSRAAAEDYVRRCQRFVELRLEARQVRGSPGARKWLGGAKADFLGITLSCRPETRRLRVKSESWSEPVDFVSHWRVVPRAPVLKIAAELQRDGFTDDRGSPVGKGEWTTAPDAVIVERYHRLWSSIMMHYNGVDNRREVGKLFQILRRSCAKTLARKHKNGLMWVRARYGNDLRVRSGPDGPGATFVTPKAQRTFVRGWNLTMARPDPMAMSAWCVLRIMAEAGGYVEGKTVVKKGKRRMKLLQEDAI